MSLRLGQCDVYFQWDTTWETKVVRTAGLALLDCGEAIAEAIANDPATPEDTGALKDSVRVAPPGYDQDDTPLVVRAGRPDPLNDPPVSLNRSQVRNRRGTTAQALSGHRGVLIAAGANPGNFTGGVGELVEDDGERLHTWVGSWVNYAFFVHQGYYNVWAQSQAVGRPYIARVAMPMFQAEYARFFVARWAQVAYEAA